MTKMARDRRVKSAKQWKRKQQKWYHANKERLAAQDLDQAHIQELRRRGLV